MTAVCPLLLIEDDHDEALAIEKACCPDPSNVAIDVYNNGAEAEDALREGEYDLVICDLALPSDARRFRARYRRGPEAARADARTVSRDSP